MKKSILTFAIICVFTIGSFAKGDGKSTLTVTIKNLQSTEGLVSVTVFDSKESFLENGIQKTAKIDGSGTVTLVFENLADGDYAASSIHDINANGELDTGTFGIPSEPYGFSNDARGTFGPASFDDSKFTISGDKQISITVK